MIHVCARLGLEFAFATGQTSRLDNGTSSLRFLASLISPVWLIGSLVGCITQLLLLLTVGRSVNAHCVYLDDGEILEARNCAITASGGYQVLNLRLAWLIFRELLGAAGGDQTSRKNIFGSLK